MTLGKLGKMTGQKTEKIYNTKKASSAENYILQILQFPASSKFPHFQLSRLVFCAKPENSVLDFQKLRCQNSSKTQFLSKNSVPKLPKLWFSDMFFPKSLKKCRILTIKRSFDLEFWKTQFQKCKNSVFQKFPKHKWRKKCTKNKPV